MARFPSSPAWCALPVALTLILLGPWIVEIDANGVRWAYHLDTDVYREGARALWRGDDLYEQRFTVGDTALPFTYPPFAAMAFLPLAAVSAEIAGLAMTIVSLTCLWWVIALVVKSKTLAAWLLPVAALFEPVRDTISFGQINLLLMALVTADALGRPNRRTAGVWAGIAAALKLTPATFIVFFLVRGQFRAAGVMVLTAVSATVLAGLLRPEMSWNYWVDTLINTDRIGNPEYATNQSLAGALARMTEPVTADRWWLIGAVVLLALSVYAAWRVRFNAVATLAVTSLIALLLSPVSWSHHWVWLIVVVLALVPAARIGSTSARILGGLLLLIALLPPHRLAPMGGGQELEWPWWLHLAGNSYVLGAVALLALAAAAPALLTGKVGRQASISLSTRADR